MNFLLELIFFSISSFFWTILPRQPTLSYIDSVFHLSFFQDQVRMVSRWKFHFFVCNFVLKWIFGFELGSGDIASNNCLKRILYRCICIEGVSFTIMFEDCSNFLNPFVCSWFWRTGLTQNRGRCGSIIVIYSYGGPTLFCY